MIPSRVTAVPIDGGDRVKGWYACINGINHLIFTGVTEVEFLVPYPWGRGDDFVRIEVDPATIEPVQGGEGMKEPMKLTIYDLAQITAACEEMGVLFAWHMQALGGAQGADSKGEKSEEGTE